MIAAAIPWGTLLFDSTMMFLTLLGLGLGLIGIWTLLSRERR